MIDNATQIIDITVAFLGHLNILILLAENVWRHIESVDWEVDLIIHFFIEYYIVRFEAVEGEN